MDPPCVDPPSLKLSRRRCRECECARESEDNDVEPLSMLLKDAAPPSSRWDVLKYINPDYETLDRMLKTVQQSAAQY